MKKCILAIVLFGAHLFSYAEVNESDVEVGILEHLGDTLPLNTLFFNESDDTVTLGSLIDKPTILSFVYFDCPGMCSPLLSGVSDVVSKLDMELGKDYQVITISFNTKDTPQKAKQKKQNFVNKISKDHREYWMYLTGSQESINRVTEAAGFKYKPQGVDFSHASAIILISPGGKITRYLYGVTFLPFDLKMAIIESQKGTPRPTINRILEYCFAYNPESRSYGFQVLKIVGSIVIFILAILFIVLLIRGRNKIAVKE